MALTNHHYTVGWVAALEVELAAAMAMLDEQHPKLNKDVADTNSYTFGSIGAHNVIVTGLPSGSIGNNAAVHAATNMLRSFPKIRFILMVGVGGGVSDASVAPLKDVRLGDIVVSNPEGPHGGVVQYDFGAGSQASGFVRRGVLNKPPIALRTALTEFRANARLNRYSFMKHYEDVFTRSLGMQREEYEPPQYDRLYNAGYVHIGGRDCSSCSDSELVVRKNRTKQGPMVHFGTIGSANMVLRDALLRDELYKDGMICFEMEAAGLMDLGCLVIRGICDYCDSHKNDDWQPYASMVAAAFAKDLLLSIEAKVIDAIPEATLDLLRDDIHELTSDTKQLINVHQSRDLLAAIHWLDAPDVESSHRKALESREGGTGSWLLDSTAYNDWKRGAIRHVWLHGKAGCGKTIISATVTEDVRAHCKTRDGLQCVVFHFAFSDTRKQSYLDCLRSLLSQIITTTPISSLLVQLYHASQGIPASRQSLEKLLYSALESTETLYLILDALDESPETYDGNRSVRQELLDRLVTLTSNCEKLKLFATSRELGDIEAHAEMLGAHPIAMSTGSINTDIARYISGQLTTDVKLRGLHPEMKNRIRSVLMDNADGMFRWAYCQIREILELQSLKKSNVDGILRTLPKSLDETYDRIIERIHNQSKVEALVMLRWLAYSQRPLTLRELAETTTIDPYHGKDGSVNLTNREEFGAILDILSGLVTIIEHSQEPEKNANRSSMHAETSSGSLVEYYDDLDMEIDLDDLEVAFEEHETDNMQVDESFEAEELVGTRSCSLHANNLVKLAHFSVKEYLESARISRGPARFFHLDEVNAQSFLSQSSIAYLIHYADSKRRSGKSDDLIRFPLLQYTARFWFIHYREVEEFFPSIAVLNSRKVLECWLEIYDPDSPDHRPFENSNSSIRRKVASGIYYAAMLNLPSTLERLFRSGMDANSQGGWYETPLYAAVRLGYHNIAELLIEHGADVNAQIESFHANILGAACAAGQEALVKLLIEHGADINVRKKGHIRSPLAAALTGGYDDVIRVLLENGANMDGPTSPSIMLAYAIRTENEQLVHILIRLGIDVNEEPIILTDLLRRLSMMKLLVQNGWKITDPVDDEGRSLVHYLMDCRIYSTIVLHFLLANGLDVNLLDEKGETSLMMATHNNNLQAIDDIIAANGEADIQNIDGRSALHIAVSSGYSETVSRLLNAGADKELMDHDGHLPLDLAVINANTETVRLLVDAGADIKHHLPNGNTLLIEAILFTSNEIVRILLNAKADMESRDHHGRSALECTVRVGNDAAMALLVKAGVCVGYDIIKQITIHNQVTILNILLNTNIDLNMVDDNGWPLLLHVVESGRISIMKTLLTAGADVNFKGSCGSAALHHAARLGITNMVECLIDAKADQELEDDNGRTAFWHATKHNHESVWCCLSQLEIYQLMRRDHFGVGPLHVAAWNGDLDKVKDLVRWIRQSLLGRSPRSEEREFAAEFSGDVRGRSVFHYAAISGSTETFDFLINHLALCGQSPVVEWPDHVDKSGKTVLDYACLSGNYWIVERALELIPEEHHVDGRWSSMHWACRSNSYSTLGMLAAAGRTASVVRTNQTGLNWTPLDVAIYFSNEGLVHGDSLRSKTWCSYYWEELIPSGIVIRDGDNGQIIAYRENELLGLEPLGTECDGCLQDLGPLYYQCLSCEALQYCMMCSHASEALHTNHEWIFVDERGE